MLILSGDQLYRMNFRLLLERHAASGAQVTVATTPVRPEAAHAFGIMGMDPDGRVVRFVEKPHDPEVQRSLRVDWSRVEELESPVDPDALPASMGIYVFDRAILAEALQGNEADFGKHVIPRIIETHRVHAFQYQGYWEDIGTIRSFYEANLDLCEPLPKFNFYDATAPIFTHARYLPGTKIIKSQVERSVIADGCIINDALIEHSLVGRARPDRGGRDDPRVAHHGRGLLRDAGSARARRARRRSESARGPGSSAPSWTRTPGSATRCASPPRARRIISTAPISTCATASSWCPRTPSS